MNRALVIFWASFALSVSGTSSFTPHGVSRSPFFSVDIPRGGIIHPSHMTYNDNSEEQQTTSNAATKKKAEPRKIPSPRGGPLRSGAPPPQGGPPQGGDVVGGRSPPTTPAQKIVEVAFELAFSLLYVGDDLGVRDSSKNLRVLWTRALLHSLEKIEDSVASQLLPTKTRWVVGNNSVSKSIWSNLPVVIDKLNWIVDRTNFIDGQLEEFLKMSGIGTTRRQVLLLGAGYDTRALRYLRKNYKNVHFYEVDIPSVSDTKQTMVRRYLEENNSNNNNNNSITFLPMDLNEILTRNKSLLPPLQAQGFIVDDSSDVSTMVVCEAVLFYMIPGAVQKLWTEELFALKNCRRYCLTDNLSKVGVTPGGGSSPREKCRQWLEKHGQEIVAHDSIWGGAIHFVGSVPIKEREKIICDK